MLDSMDAKEACSNDKGHHERYKGNVSCVRDPDGYTCHFGFHLSHRGKHRRRDLLIRAMQDGRNIASRISRTSFMLVPSKLF